MFDSPHPAERMSMVNLWLPWSITTPSFSSWLSTSFHGIVSACYVSHYHAIYTFADSEKLSLRRARHDFLSRISRPLRSWQSNHIGWWFQRHCWLIICRSRWCPFASARAIIVVPGGVAAPVPVPVLRSRLAVGPGAWHVAVSWTPSGWIKRAILCLLPAFFRWRQGRLCWICAVVHIGSWRMWWMWMRMLVWKWMVWWRMVGWKMWMCWSMWMRMMWRMWMWRMWCCVCWMGLKVRWPTGWWMLLQVMSGWSLPWISVSIRAWISWSIQISRWSFRSAIDVSLRNRSTLTGVPCHSTGWVWLTWTWRGSSEVAWCVVKQMIQVSTYTQMSRPLRLVFPLPSNGWSAWWWCNIILDMQTAVHLPFSSL